MTLDPESELLLDASRELGLPPIESLDPVQAREIYDGRTGAVKPPEIAHVEDRLIPGPGGELPVRIYRDVGDDVAAPIMMFFHGGGWVFGTVDTHDAICRLLAKLTGAVVVSVEYRLAPEHPHPAAVDDCETATDWALENAAAIGADPDRLAVCGDSAGGNLAAVVAQTLRDRGATALRAQVLVYPATDLSLTGTDSYVKNGDGYLLTAAAMRWFGNHYTGGDGGQDPRVSPYFGELHGLPPTFLLTCGYDPLRDDGRRYAGALINAGVDVTYVELAGNVHSFFTMVGVLNSTTQAAEQIASFLEPVL